MAMQMIRVTRKRDGAPAGEGIQFYDGKLVIKLFDPWPAQHHDSIEEANETWPTLKFEKVGDAFEVREDVNEVGD